jgi:1,4-dihydroxy-2-naphthoate octaprenyltransferase
VPVLVGTALAASHDAFAPLPALAALLGALAIQIGTNLANDYFDARKGADADRVGPLRVTAAGLVTGAQMKRAMAASFGFAVLCGIYLAWIGGWPIVIAGILSILSGIAYTGGPCPLGYQGLGDLFVFVFFGIVAVAGTYFVQARALHPAIAWTAAPIGLLSVAILAINNLRDVESDARCGKRTLVVRFGRPFGRIEYAFCLLASPIIIGLAAAIGGLPRGTAITVAALPLAVPLIRTAWSAQDPAPMIRALGGTARFLVVFGVLLSVGLLL